MTKPASLEKKSTDIKDGSKLCKKILNSCAIWSGRSRFFRRWKFCIL